MEQTMEQQVANSILKDLRNHPDKPILVTRIKNALASPVTDDNAKKFLTWLLTGKYAPEILSYQDIIDYSTNSNAVIKHIIDLINTYNNNDIIYQRKIRDQLLDDLNRTPKFNQLFQIAKLIDPYITEGKYIVSSLEGLKSNGGAKWAEEYQKDPENTIKEIMRRLYSVVTNEFWLYKLESEFRRFSSDRTILNEVKYQPAEFGIPLLIDELMKYQKLGRKIGVPIIKLNTLYKELNLQYTPDPVINAYIKLMNIVQEQIPEYYELIRLANMIFKNYAPEGHVKFIQFLGNKQEMLNAYENDPDRIVPEIKDSLYSIVYDPNWVNLVITFLANESPNNPLLNEIKNYPPEEALPKLFEELSRLYESQNEVMNNYKSYYRDLLWRLNRK